MTYITPWKLGSATLTLTETPSAKQLTIMSGLGKSLGGGGSVGMGTVKERKKTYKIFIYECRCLTSFMGNCANCAPEPEVHLCTIFKVKTQGLDSVIHRKLFAKSYLVLSICFNLETSQWSVIISEVAFSNMKILLQKGCNSI